MTAVSHNCSNVEPCSLHLMTQSTHSVPVSRRSASPAGPSRYTVTSPPSLPDRYAAMIRSSTTDPSTSVWIGRSPVVTQCTK